MALGGGCCRFRGVPSGEAVREEESEPPPPTPIDKTDLVSEVYR